ISISASIVVFSIVLGPVAGALGVAFMRGVAWAQSHQPNGWHILVVMHLAFTAIGVVAMWYPQILGNGRAAAQLGFDQIALSTAPLITIVLIFLIKPFSTIGTIAAGGSGGTLTPSVAIGSLLGILGGAAWSLMWPGVPLVGFALVAAAAFLSATMRAPLTALVLVLDLSR